MNRYNFSYIRIHAGEGLNRQAVVSLHFASMAYFRFTSDIFTLQGIGGGREALKCRHRPGSRLSPIQRYHQVILM